MIGKNRKQVQASLRENMNDDIKFFLYLTRLIDSKNGGTLKKYIIESVIIIISDIKNTFQIKLKAIHINCY